MYSLIENESHKKVMLHLLNFICASFIWNAIMAERAEIAVVNSKHGQREINKILEK